MWMGYAPKVIYTRSSQLSNLSQIIVLFNHVGWCHWSKSWVLLVSGHIPSKGTPNEWTGLQKYAPHWYGPTQQDNIHVSKHLKPMTAIKALRDKKKILLPFLESNMQGEDTIFDWVHNNVAPSTSKSAPWKTNYHQLSPSHKNYRTCIVVKYSLPHSLWTSGAWLGIKAAVLIGLTNAPNRQIVGIHVCICFMEHCFIIC